MAEGLKKVELWKWHNQYRNNFLNCIDFLLYQTVNSIYPLDKNTIIRYEQYD